MIVDDRRVIVRVYYLIRYISSPDLCSSDGLGEPERP